MNERILSDHDSQDSCFKQDVKVQGMRNWGEEDEDTRRRMKRMRNETDNMRNEGEDDTGKRSFRGRDPFNRKKTKTRISMNEGRSRQMRQQTRERNISHGYYLYLKKTAKRRELKFK